MVFDSATMMRRRNYMLVWLWLVYTLLLFYGTWFPLENWDWSLGGPAAFIEMGWPRHVPFTDILLNLFVYLPFGFFTMRCLPGSVGKRLFLSTFAGALLCSFLELGQTYIAGRVTSPIDILLNTTGTTLGAIIAGIIPRVPLVRQLQATLWSTLRDPGIGRLGLLALALWALSQWTPLVPSLDFGNIKDGLAPIKASIVGDTSFNLTRFTKYFLMLLGVGSVALATFYPGRRHTRWIGCFLMGVLAIKVVMVNRVLTGEALLAAFTVIVCFPFLQRLQQEKLRHLATLSLVVFYSFSSQIPGTWDTSLRSMNWRPFLGHLSGLNGLFNLLELVWIFVALAFSLTGKTPASRGLRLVQGFLLLSLTTLLEWAQQSVPGRYPDVTDVVVAMAAWWLACRWPWQLEPRKNETLDRHAPVPSIPRWWLFLVVPALLGISFLVGTSFTSYSGRPESSYSLPDPALLPAPALQNFRSVHPRLPSPSASDIALIKEHNPRFWKRHRKAAKDGKFYSRILMALAESGSVDLVKLHQDLLNLEFVWRGHNQTVPLAVAYDWLYDTWTPEQRRSLLHKVEQACQFQIYVIREKYALSPYNVYLYNSPLQALMMAALASHEDSADDGCMRFTADYWRNRVIPVWRQVMGKNGGWHEGGEYIGIGIGQAIYRLPAMWRKATGEDYFSRELGIRGFLDFAVFRTRPDGTHMRLGDAGFFNRNIPDLAALALEYRHSAAYTLARPSKKPEPMSRPWGPLTQPSLDNKEAVKGLPLSHYFDGLGLLIARSDWGDDAMWVTFKAGDNYWSHSHLDQGAFTIFRGGALAIDSGLYGPSYGSDHHLNYTSQTIAHNVLTITDPDDNLPYPPRKEGDKERPIANDGGQRRVGSGWGRQAPLDHLHWLQLQYHYRTVGKTLWHEGQEMVWKVADLTPAYTNKESGTGSFEARARRVENYQRSFIYLRNLDLVIVYDRLEVTQPNFTKKWLLHSQHAPRINGTSFNIEVPHNSATGMSGGRLRGKVLLPDPATLNAIGGPGLEFYVDGKNYDEGGLVAKKAARKKGSEPGNWRIELRPTQESRLTEFLVVMQAETLNQPAPELEFQLRSRKDRLELSIGGPEETTIFIPRSLQAITLGRP